MQIPEIIRSRFRFAGDLARAAEVAGVLAKYGLAGWLTDSHVTLELVAARGTGPFPDTGETASACAGGSGPPG